LNYLGGKNLSRVEKQLRNQNLGDVKATAFGQVGQALYPDASASNDLAMLSSIVSAWRSSHIIGYGGSIPSTGATSSTVIGDVLTEEEILACGENEAYAIQAVSFENTGLAPITCELRLEGAVLDVVLCNPNERTPCTNLPKFAMVFGNSLQVYQRDGSSAEITALVAYCKTSV